MFAAAAIFLGTLEFHGEIYEIEFINQFKIEFLLPLTDCRKVLGKMPGKSPISAQYKDICQGCLSYECRGVFQIQSSIYDTDFLRK